jgi:hypothetical protein
MNVGDALGGNGSGWSIEHGGKTYRARVISQKVKAAFETWLSQRVLRQFLSAQDAGSKDYEQAVGVVADRIALGRYGFHGPVAQQAMQSPEGVFALTRLVFECTEEELVALLAERGTEVNTIMKLVFARSFPQVRSSPATTPEESPDPNPEGPGA